MTLMIVVVEVLYNILYKMFVKELLNLNIGYNFNDNNLREMINLVNAIDYIERNTLKNEEIVKILQYYEEKL